MSTAVGLSNFGYIPRPGNTYSHLEVVGFAPNSGSSGSILVNNQVVCGAGSVTAPSLCFLADSKTGAYRSASGSFSIASLGVLVWTFGSSGASSVQPLTILPASAQLVLGASAGTQATISATAQNAATTYTIPAIPAAITSSNLLAGCAQVVTVTSQTTLTAAQSGSLVCFTKGSAYSIFLPAVAVGLNFRFIQNGAGAAFTVSIDANSTILIGQLVNGPVGGLLGVSTVVSASKQQINFLTGASERGAWCQVWCDGTNWYFNAQSLIASGLSVTP